MKVDLTYISKKEAKAAASKTRLSTSYCPTFKKGGIALNENR